MTTLPAVVILVLRRLESETVRFEYEPGGWHVTWKLLEWAGYVTLEGGAIKLTAQGREELHATKSA